MLKGVSMPDDIHTRIIVITSIGAGLMYLFKNNIRQEISIYRDKETGKFIWWLFIMDFIIHICMAAFGATLVFYAFELKILLEYKDYQLISAITGGLIAREAMPIVLELAIEEITELVEKRRNSRKRD